MDMASCVDISSDEDPQTNCVCQLGRVMNEEGDECIIPLPTTPTPRPAPSLAPAVKMATFMDVDRVQYSVSSGVCAPLCRLYFCRHCLKLRSTECVSHEVSYMKILVILDPQS